MLIESVQSRLFVFRMQSSCAYEKWLKIKGKQQFVLFSRCRFFYLNYLIGLIVVHFLRSKTAEIPTYTGFSAV